MASDKIPKVVAGYLPRRYVDLERLGTSCSKCYAFFKVTSECAILEEPKVSGSSGTCCYFLPGHPPATLVKPMFLIPKSVAGYIEGDMVPTYCGRCRYYDNERSRTSTCAKVGDSDSDTVEYGGCCNAYEAKDA